jgi:hypothetical protein
LILAGCVVDEKCYSDADCPSSDVCKDGDCVAKECDVDPDCVSGGVCRQGQCVLVCGGSECPKLPHARSVCGCERCTYVCDQGWSDDNRLAADGCEASQCVAAAETCNGHDDDCNCPGDTNGDGVWCGPGDEGVDEGSDKTSPDTCGPYCCVCMYPNAASLCVEGRCRMGDCAPGWHDVNGSDVDGCECPQPSSGEETCDGIDNNCDGCVDEGGVCGIDCPCDMVPVDSAFCIDRYEASRPDATAANAGADESVATSRAGVLPWMVNPLTRGDFLRFHAACEAAGKDLCASDEWFASCTGPPPGTAYAFGDTFDREICNCVDTFCDDHCAENGIPPTQCNTGTNCGYAYNCFRAMPTGTFTACASAYGALDVNGNAWEVVASDSDPRGYEVRGGAFNCASPAVRLRCTFNAGWADLHAGFRCCSAPELPLSDAESRLLAARSLVARPEVIEGVHATIRRGRIGRGS